MVLILFSHLFQVRKQTASKLYETLLVYSAAVPEENCEVSDEHIIVKCILNHI